MNNSTVNKSRTRELVRTEDGSFTFFIPEAEETYHSIHGADQEGKFVFIEQGLRASNASPVRILEVGMGTGLNVVLTTKESSRLVDYVTLEPFPIEEAKINEWILSRVSDVEMAQRIHDMEWDATAQLTPQFQFRKVKAGVMEFQTTALFDVIYFDAFGPKVEPELWTLEVMQKCFDLLHPGGIWVSYCAKGEVRRNLQSAGFKVERLPGPPGKREMLRAIK
jgi:tRNA U34 5-methylaminomethyl-2-thiouridine-forming methyltransferase MnmC